MYRFPDPSVHPAAFSVDQLGAVPVYDMVERDGVVCDCRLVLLCCCGFTGGSCVSPYIALYRQRKQQDGPMDQGSDTHPEKQDKSMSRDKGPTNFHTSMITYSTPQQHLVDSRSHESSGGCRNVNNNNEYKGCILMNLSTYVVWPFTTMNSYCVAHVAA